MVIKKPTKAHIICHLLFTNGPDTKANLLRQTAAILGKPYKPGSNMSYFDPCNNYGNTYSYLSRSDTNPLKQSLVASGLIKVVAKQGNTLVYGLDTAGFAKAAQYQDWLSAQA